MFNNRFSKLFPFHSLGIKRKILSDHLFFVMNLYRLSLVERSIQWILTTAGIKRIRTFCNRKGEEAFCGKKAITTVGIRNGSIFYLSLLVSKRDNDS